MIGVDASPDMLERAGARVAGAEFRLGTLDSLPLDDGCVDVAVCALALTHVEDLGPPIAELARVVRPGGRIVLSDFHPLPMAIGGQAFFTSADGRFAMVRSWIHHCGEYVTAALAASLAFWARRNPWKEIDEQFRGFPAKRETRSWAGTRRGSIP